MANHSHVAMLGAELPVVCIGGQMRPALARYCLAGPLGLKKSGSSELLPRKAQAELLSIATAGDWTTPTCASCGTKMLLRQSQRGPFWGCAAYPRCKSTLQLSREQRAGA